MRSLIYSLAPLVLLCALARPTAAQQIEIYEEEEYLYHSEVVGGFNFTTLGGFLGGGMFRYSWAKKPTVFRNLNLEIINVKHPKETRIQSNATGSTFVLGKVNYFFMARPQYGLEYVLFRKAKEQGVQVNFIGALGPTLGLVAPYLIVYDGREVPYNPRIHNPNRIESSGSIVNSLSQANVRFGGSFKTSLTFEFGTFKSSVTGFELGFMLDVFDRDIVILADQLPVDNQSIFTSAFINIYFGSRN